MDTKRNLELYACPIGEFKQTSSKMIVSDPIFEYNNDKNRLKANLVIKNVKRGLWNTLLQINKDYEDRNADLVCIHHTKYSEDKIKNKKYVWEKVGFVWVDSGQAGVYDLKYYRDDDNVQNNPIDEKLSGEDPGEKWYAMNCYLTLNPNNYAGIIPNGAVSSSGFGDGLYNVYVIKKIGKVYGIKINFINDNEITKWEKMMKKINDEENKS